MHRGQLAAFDKLRAPSGDHVVTETHHPPLFASFLDTAVMPCSAIVLAAKTRAGINRRMGEERNEQARDWRRPWRTPEEMFPKYDPKIGRRHLADLDREVFDPTSGKM